MLKERRERAERDRHRRRDRRARPRRPKAHLRRQLELLCGNERVVAISRRKVVTARADGAPGTTHANARGLRRGLQRVRTPREELAAIGQRERRVRTARHLPQTMSCA